MANFLIYFILYIFFILLKSSGQNQNKTLFNESKEPDINLEINIDMLKFVINGVKENPGMIEEFIKFDKYDILFNFLTGLTDEQKNLIINTKNGLLNHLQYVDDLIKIIKKNSTVLDYILLFANNTNGTSGIIKIIHSFLRYHNETVELLLNLIYDYPEILNLLKLSKHSNIDKILYFLNDRDLLELIKKVVLIVIKNENYTENLFEVLEDDKFIEAFKKGEKEGMNGIIEEIFKVSDRNTKITDTLRDIVTDYLDREMKDLRFTQIIVSVLRLIFLFYTKNHKDDFYGELSPGCLGLLNYTFLGHVNNELRGNSTKYIYDKEISILYLYKLFVESTKDKNDFISFFNCLNSKPLFNITEENLNILEHQPSFVISIADLSNRKEIKKESTYFEDYYFTFGFCFPQGKEKEKNKIKNINANNSSSEYYICNNKDYEYLSKLIMSFLFIVNRKNDLKVNVIEIRKEKPDQKLLKIFAELIPLFIFLIPIFIEIFLFFYKGCVIGMKKKTLMSNKSNQIKDVNENDDEEEEDNGKKDTKKKVYKYVKLVPRWYKILNEFFNIKNNLKEQFCFSDDVTNINNNTGLVYITGLIGISMLLMIIGQLYLVLLNLPFKEFGQHQFYQLMFSVLYIFPFIGLRYSPRIIFSCSGFTLTYKFLSYISQSSGPKQIIKFIFGQFYKFLILINLILFARFSIQYFTFAKSDDTPMWRMFHEVELSQPKEFSSFIYKLFAYSVYSIHFLKYNSLVKSHDFIDYCWVSFNEIIFFIIGTSLLTIGYKCKLRIDYFILILILLIYGSKIFFYYFNFFFDTNEKKFFTTLYYYLFDYGIIMLNPLFNLPYFLIGMLFGFINYSIHKGIIDIKMNNTIYKQIHMDNNKSMSQDGSENEKLSLLPRRTTLDNNQNRETCQLNLYEEEDEYNNNKDEFKSIKSNRLTQAQKLEEINEKTRNSINSDDKSSESGESKNQMDTLSSHVINKRQLKDMPFLKSSINIIVWHRNHNIQYFFIIIIFIISLILILLIFANLIVLYIYDRKFIGYNDNDKLMEKLSLENFNNNIILNYIYLLDSEVFVFLVQWLLFILFMKRQYFFIDFFSNIHWSCFNKSQYSFLIVYSLIILNNFYSSETVIKLNLYNLFLYYGINLFFIAISTIFVYIVIELPMKKIFKYLLKEDYKIIGITEEVNEEEEEEEEDGKEDDDDDEQNSLMDKDDDDEDN